MAVFAIILSNLSINDMESFACDHKVSFHFHKVSVLVLNGKVSVCSSSLPCWQFGSNYTRQGEASETIAILSSLYCSYRLAKSLEGTSTGGGVAGRKQTYLLLSRGEELLVCSWQIQSRDWASCLCTRRIDGWYPHSCLPLRRAASNHSDVGVVEIFKIGTHLNGGHWPLKISLIQSFKFLILSFTDAHNHTLGQYWI